MVLPDLSLHFCLLDLNFGICQLVLNRHHLLFNLCLVSEDILLISLQGQLQRLHFFIEHTHLLLMSMLFLRVTLLESI